MKKITLITIIVILVLSLSFCNTKKDDSNNSNDAISKTENIVTTAAIEKKLFPRDFADVCTALPIKTAKAYDKKAGNTSHTYLFYRENAQSQYMQRSMTLPKDWEVDWQNAADTQLVACVNAVKGEKKDSCEFTIDGQGYTLELYDADYEVKLYEAQTGKLVTETVLKLQAQKCPKYQMFNKGEKVKEKLPDFKQPLTEFLKPFVYPTEEDIKKTNNPGNNS